MKLQKKRIKRCITRPFRLSCLFLRRRVFRARHFLPQTMLWRWYVRSTYIAVKLFGFIPNPLLLRAFVCCDSPQTNPLKRCCGPIIISSSNRDLEYSHPIRVGGYGGATLGGCCRRSLQALDVSHGGFTKPRAQVNLHRGQEREEVGQARSSR